LGSKNKKQIQGSDRDKERVKDVPSEPWFFFPFSRSILCLKRKTGSVKSSPYSLSYPLKERELSYEKDGSLFANNESDGATKGLDK
jgi:hypothetical protein